MIAFNAIHAEITWDLSDNGTLTISGTDMPQYTYYEHNSSVPWFSQRDKIKKVIIEKGVTNIGNYAFFQCYSLTSITIPNSVTSIGVWAFAYCSSLTSIIIPNSVTSIGGAAFYLCSSLVSINIPTSVTSIGNSAFAGTKWYDGQPDGLVYAGYVLYNYKGTMPANTNIIVKNGTKGIGGQAFSGCTGLNSVTIPNSVTSIGKRAFINCYSLTSIIVEEGNSKYDSRNSCNAIIETQSNTLIAGCMNTIIPNSVTSIEERAFNGCRYLKSIIIPYSVTSIGKYAFSDCKSLTSITIPNSVTSIEDSVFSDCI